MLNIYSVFAVLCLASAFMNDLAAAADEEVIQEIIANGTRNLQPFTVKDNWEIRWDAIGTTFQVYVNSLSENPEGSFSKLPQAAAEQIGPGKGSSHQPKGGTFSLQITSDAEWTVMVVQLP